jgi:hypothetical protein
VFVFKARFDNRTQHAGLGAVEVTSPELSTRAWLSQQTALDNTGHRCMEGLHGRYLRNGVGNGERARHSADDRTIEREERCE